MAHFAELNELDLVERVIVVHNNELLVDGVESEEKGLEFLHKLLGADRTWVQTSYNNNFRKNYAGVGDTYDMERDAFIGLQPFTSWALNEETCRWEAPVPYPDDGKIYNWDESAGSWYTSE